MSRSENPPVSLSVPLPLTFPSNLWIGMNKEVRLLEINQT